MKKISLVASAIALAALTGLPTMAEEAEVKERVRPRMCPIARFDKDGDGVLNADEIKAAKEAGFVHIERMDLNGDGIIDQEEVDKFRAEKMKRREEMRGQRKDGRQNLEQRRQKMRERAKAKGEERRDGRGKGRGRTEKDAPVIVE